MQNFSQSDFKDFWPKKDDFKETTHKAKKFTFKKWLWVLLAIVVILFATFASVFNEIMEYWQLQEIGPAYTSIYWTELTAKLLTRSVGFVILFLVLWVNLIFVKRCAITKYFHHAFFKKKWPYLVLSLLLAFSLSGILGGGLYQKLLLATNAESFGISDPLFSQDIGYYIFSRPFLMSLVDGAKALLLLLIVMSAVGYGLIFTKTGGKKIKEVVSTEKGALIHLIILSVVYFLLFVCSYQFSAENVLYSSFGSGKEIFGAGYVEAKIWRPFYQLMPFIVLVTVLMILFFLIRKKYIGALVSILIVPVAYVLAIGAAVGVDWLVVSPNERNLQSEYIAHNMDATRHAYNFAQVTEMEFKPSYDLSQMAMEQDNTWLAGTRIADFGATLTSYNQLQFLRKYYEFNDVDVVPYELDGKLNVVFLAAREMNKDNLDASAKSYTNKIFRYTHGFGAVASHINSVTAEGQPDFLIRDIPPKSTGGMTKITQPRIYYGEETNDYVIVGGGNKELDYSEGIEDIEYTFEGDTGVNMTFFKRLMFALYYKDYRMLVSSNINADSKILLNRNVLQRVERVAPFLRYDTDPYLVISDEGELYWVVNGYTTSADYPYAQPYGNMNYIRNSVTVTVNAYNGNVNFYLTDESDPLARAYRKIYPELFTEGDVPDSIKYHTRVPEYLFKVQTELYQRYHVQDPGQFFDRADAWDIASEKYQEDEILVEPYYNIMEIDGQKEMVLMRPFVVQGKHNLVGLLVQRSGQEHYGDLMLYRFPKNETVYGPMQVENKIDNDPDISREMTLWGQGGSQVIRGNLLIVPYKNSLLYIEPIYITSKNNASLPELKRIVVGYGDSIAMEPSLEEALKSVFAENRNNGGMQVESQSEQSVPQILDEEMENLETVIREVLDSYDAFRQSAQGGNWSAMGQNLDELDRNISRLKEHK